MSMKYTCADETIRAFLTFSYSRVRRFLKSVGKSDSMRFRKQLHSTIHVKPGSIVQQEEKGKRPTCE